MKTQSELKQTWDVNTEHVTFFDDVDAAELIADLSDDAAPYIPYNCPLCNTVYANDDGTFTLHGLLPEQIACFHCGTCGGYFFVDEGEHEV